MELERLYSKLPLSLQNWVVGLEGRRIRSRRYGPMFHRHLEAYNARGGWDAARIGRYRDRRLAAFVRHAARTTPYYRDLFARAGIDPDRIRGLADLEAIPVLGRREVGEQTERFRSDVVRERSTIRSHTSGTTGAGLRFAVTLDGHREQWAVWWRYRGWHGLKLGTPGLYFGGRVVVPPEQRRPPFWRYNRSGRQILFSSFHLGPETAHHYLEEMARSGYRWIHGYPSMISLVAGYALEAGVKLDIRWVSLGAESLLPRQAEAIERAFGVTPIEHYGLAEAAANISECPGGSLHVDEDFSAVEFLPIGEDQHRVVGTNFSNPAFPLLRYDAGDVATVTGRRCDCGRPGRVVDRIDGRIEDTIVTKRGAILGRLDHIFKDLDKVREAQLRQTRKGEMQILVVRGRGFTERDEKALRAETIRRVGHQVDFSIEYVERLPRTARGKLRFVSSTVADARVGSTSPEGDGARRAGAARDSMG